MAEVPVLPAALAAHRLWDLCDAFDDGPAQARQAGAPLLGEVRVVHSHLLGLVDLQLGIQLLQFVLVCVKRGALMWGLGRLEGLMGRIEKENRVSRCWMQYWERFFGDKTRFNGEKTLVIKHVQTMMIEETKFYQLPL